MTGLIQTAILIAMICVVEFLMRRKVRKVTHPPKRHQDRPAAVVHEVDKGIYGV